MLVPAGLLFALSLMILIQQWQAPSEGAPGRAAEPATSVLTDPRGGSEDLRFPDAAPGGGGAPDPLRGSPLQGAVDILPFEQNEAPEPYEPTPAILAAVRDHELLEPGFPEQEGLIELFHRWRSGPAVPIEVIEVEWRALPQFAPVLRGRRMSKVFSLIEEPIARFLPPNRSGVHRYWEAFATDLDGGHIVRLDFLERPEVLGPGDEVEAEVDFFRLHRYTPLRGGDAVVPEYVSGRLERVRPPVRAESDWTPFLLAGGFSFLGLGLLVLQNLRAGAPARVRSRPRAGRRTVPAPPRGTLDPGEGDS
ncbi:MAG: hypothetical protein ACO4B4_10835 [Planctomycetota bacterium]